jgi:DNA-binding response OmpR family regulator
MRVLLVEDDVRIATFLRKGLGSAGFIVDWVESGAEALTCARTLGGERPDIVILDLGLPDADGLDVLAALRSSGCRTRVVILTARSEAADRARAATLGIDDYLTKPFSMAELLASLRAG